MVFTEVFPRLPPGVPPQHGSDLGARTATLAGAPPAEGGGGPMPADQARATAGDEPPPSRSLRNPPGRIMQHTELTQPPRDYLTAFEVTPPRRSETIQIRPDNPTEDAASSGASTTPPSHITPISENPDSSRPVSILGPPCATTRVEARWARRVQGSRGTCPP